ncbi:MAG: trans-2-enoyl-CoA reductase family protein [Chloroflexi bacterium]|nr:trans-2-enoyl-CoA reductase family protein [Chloroflexota bacterium]
MSEQVVKPRIRGFISLTAHPDGCAANVREQVAAIDAAGLTASGGTALVLGSSTGYGLASVLVAAFGLRAKTLGVCFERPPEDDKPASAGWYNLAEARRLASERGLTFETVNGDAFSSEVKEGVIARLRAGLGPADLVVYSIAAPRRRGDDGTIWNSVLKPIGRPYTGLGFDLRNERVVDSNIEPASPEEIATTVKVMGGEDWTAWVEALHAAGLLAPGCRTVAYSYIGPEFTAAIYRRGTIGRAKEHLETTAHQLDRRLQEAVGGHAWVSINTGVVTQASAAIPAVPLYMSILFKVLKERGLYETAVDQIVRLVRDHVGPGVEPRLDPERRIRLDDREMRPEIQQAITELWLRARNENLAETTDYAGYKRDFERLFGFGVDGVDYDAPTEIDRSLG